MSDDELSESLLSEGVLNIGRSMMLNESMLLTEEDSMLMVAHHRTSGREMVQDERRNVILTPVLDDDDSMPSPASREINNTQDAVVLGEPVAASNATSPSVPARKISFNERALVQWDKFATAAMNDNVLTFLCCVLVLLSLNQIRQEFLIRELQAQQECFGTSHIAPPASSVTSSILDAVDQFLVNVKKSASGNM